MLHTRRDTQYTYIHIYVYGRIGVRSSRHRDEDSDCEYEGEDEDHEGVPSSRVASEARDPGWQVLWQTRDIEVELELERAR